ncbi:putative sulfate transporter, partial [Trifolium pratense]
DDGGGKIAGGKVLAGGVFDGRKELKDGGGVNVGFKLCDVNVSGSNLKRYVSLYFTNFPAQLPKFYLRKDFEVCGMLEDVFVAKKRNKYGQPYGFVKYSNVRNVSKMTNALNNVWFGHFRVRASMALFERNDSRASKRMETQKSKKAVMEQVDASLLKDEKQELSRHEAPIIREEGLKPSERHSQCESVRVPRVEKELSVPTEGVRVGDIVVGLGARKVQLAQKKAQQERNMLPTEKNKPQAVTGTDCGFFMKSYRTKSVDVEWARNGVVATIINGEAFGGCRRYGDGEKRQKFFQLFFSNWIRWDTDALPYRRGAWVRLYEIPLHAWNEEFFKLCVFDCGRFLRTDCWSAEKDRLDYARVLIATPNLGIIKRVETVLVDGCQVEVKIVEEWGFDMAEDSCLVVEESGSDVAKSDCGEGHVDPEVSRDVDALFNNIKEGFEDEAGVDVQGLREKEYLDKQIEGEPEEEVEQRSLPPNPIINSVETSSNVRPSSQRTPRDPAFRPERSSAAVEAHAHPSVRMPRNKRTNSCPPVARRSVISGPWSLEWINDQNHGDAGVIFSASKEGRKGYYSGQSSIKKGQQDTLKKKAGGVLRHPLHSIKKVARMPNNDRREILKVLKKKVRRRRGGDDINRSCSVSRLASSGDSSSSGSISNDWKNWVAVHGNDQLAVDDVWGIGKAIGIKFKGDNVNMFNILSRAGKGKKEYSSRGSVGEPRPEKGC